MTLAVSQVRKSICALAEKKRISATSVMVVYEDWDIHCPTLAGFHNHLDIGLHFVLTDAPPVSPIKNIASIVSLSARFYNMKPFGPIFTDDMAGRLSSPRSHSTKNRHKTPRGSKMAPV